MTTIALDFNRSFELSPLP